MKNNNLGYYFKEGIGSIFNHGFMSFASVCITVACLIVMGSFSLLALNVNDIVRSFEDENVVLAFVDENYSSTQAQNLKSAILSVEHVENAEYISKDSAYKSFVSKYEDSTMFSDLDAEVLRDRFAVYLDDIAYTADVQNALSLIPGIVNVNANLSIAKGFMTARNIISAISIVLVVILFMAIFNA